MGMALYRARIVRSFSERQEREADLQARVADRTAELVAANQALHKARANADEANQAKSLFLASMSHDLRTPLNAIIGFADLMLEDTFGPVSPPRYREYIGDIKSSGEVLLALLNSILDLSKLEAGRRDVSPTRLDGFEFCKQCIKLVRRPADAKRITLDLQCDNDVPIFVDELAGREILLNLLTNALKFTPEGGRVTVTLKSDIATGTEMTVSDTGIGMDEEGIRLALEPYKQAHNRQQQSALMGGLNDRGIAGTGLGLPITAQLVALHRGRLTIESAPAQGTSIRIWLPLVAEEALLKEGAS